jgi:hypothetical protein
MKRLHSTLGAAVLVTGALAAGATLAPQAARSAGRPKPIVYQTKQTCCDPTVLGGQASPTRVLQSGPLSPGTYLVHALVGLNMGAYDNVVCATTPDSLGYRNNDSVFGGAGNGSGTAGVYGSAAIEDTWTVSAGDRIDITCNVTNPGSGTLATQAVLELVKVGTLTSS